MAGSSNSLSHSSFESNNVVCEDLNLVEKDYEIANAGSISSLCLGSYCQDIEVANKVWNDTTGTTTYNLEEAEEFSVGIDGYNYSFPISRHRQVIFIMQKGVGDESFIAVG